MEEENSANIRLEPDDAQGQKKWQTGVYILLLPLLLLLQLLLPLLLCYYWYCYCHYWHWYCHYCYFNYY
jgi:hypothetical protein